MTIESLKDEYRKLHPEADPAIVAMAALKALILGAVENNTGPDGRLKNADVLTALQQNAAPDHDQ